MIILKAKFSSKLALKSPETISPIWKYPMAESGIELWTSRSITSESKIRKF